MSAARRPGVRIPDEYLRKRCVRTHGCVRKAQTWYTRLEFLKIHDRCSQPGRLPCETGHVIDDHLKLKGSIFWSASPAVCVWPNVHLIPGKVLACNDHGSLRKLLSSVLFDRSSVRVHTEGLRPSGQWQLWPGRYAAAANGRHAAATGLHKSSGRADYLRIPSLEYPPRKSHFRRVFRCTRVATATVATATIRMP
jgi:hypothetical protein